VPVLTAVIGASAVLSVVIGNLISSFVLLPLTLTLLEAGSPSQKKKHGASVVWSSLSWGRSNSRSSGRRSWES
jgi:hypothetical protein